MLRTLCAAAAGLLLAGCMVHDHVQPIDTQEAVGGALTRGTWTWKSDVHPEPVDLYFHADGTVHHIGMQGRWKARSLRSVAIDTSTGEKFVLRFNNEFTAYEGNQFGVHGEFKADGE